MTEKVTIGAAELWHGDCREVLPLLPKHDLLLTDPPYGIRADENPVRGKWGVGIETSAEAWDRERPDAALVKAAVASATRCIVWGGNYFADLLPPSQRWLVWDKMTRNFSLADCEMAWTNYDNASRIYTASRNPDPDKEHPTQKPLGLMVWCIGIIAKHPNTVLDPFMGSGTTGVACAQLGKTFTGIERERKYFDIACERISRAQAQGQLLPPEPPRECVQEGLL